MRFVKIVFWIAGVWGVLVVTPLYFIHDIIGRGRNDPTLPIVKNNARLPANADDRIANVRLQTLVCTRISQMTCVEVSRRYSACSKSIQPQAGCPCGSPA
jgi:hypothetical protein